MRLRKIRGIHRNHYVTYREKSTLAFDVVGLADDNTIIYERNSLDIIQVDDTYFYCETCNEILEGDEIGGGDYWETEAR